MKVKLIPGPRDEEKIAMILNSKRTMNEEDYADFLTNLADEPEYFDAMYYACENGNEMLADQERYFNDLLFWDERHYYAARMGGFEF